MKTYIYLLSNGTISQPAECQTARQGMVIGNWEGNSIDGYTAILFDGSQFSAETEIQLERCVGEYINKQ